MDNLTLIGTSSNILGTLALGAAGTAVLAGMPFGGIIATAGLGILALSGVCSGINHAIYRSS